MANYAACDKTWVVESDPMEEERYTTTKLSGRRDFTHLLGLALSGNLVNSCFHLLIACQVVVFYWLQVFVQLIHKRNTFEQQPTTKLLARV